MSSVNNFEQNKAYKKGLIGQNILVDRLGELNCVAEVINGNPYYDLKIVVDNQNYYLEVKYDEYANKSGNLAFEVWNTYRDKPSGCAITKAHIWAHILNSKTILLADTNDIRELVSETKPYKIIEKAGDCNARLFLYNINTIHNLFINLAETGQEDFEIWLRMLIMRK